MINIAPARDLIFGPDLTSRVFLGEKFGLKKCKKRSVTGDDSRSKQYEYIIFVSQILQAI